MANKGKNTASVDPLAQVAERVRSSSNILIALSKDPNIDELSSALALAMILDKYGKHATAIFSGETPNIISFLQPEKTFESDTNSLQDFIIALDKEKADHIRYKIDGDFVKVFITPYKTTLDESDLEYSHGDYNVDLIIALNVKSESELDSALVEYGRIKHDASSINISPAAPGSFGDIEWGDPSASSVSEMIYRLAIDLQDPEAPIVDENIATTILTGVISATNRFSNERTTADTLAAASNLMASGANQQLIAKNIPVDILTAQSEAQAPAVEVEEEPAVEVEPVVEEQPVDPTNFSIAHQPKTEEMVEEAKVEDKAPGEKLPEIKPIKKEPINEPAPIDEKITEAPVAPVSEAPAIEENPSDAKSETERIVAEAEQKRADEKAKAEAEAERKRQEEEAREKAQAEKNRATMDEVLEKVNAERANNNAAPKAPTVEPVLPPEPPKEFVNKEESKATAEPVKAEENKSVESSEPTVIPNAIKTEENILPPPPAPFDPNTAMPPAMPTSASEPVSAAPAVKMSEPTVIPNAISTAAPATATPVVEAVKPVTAPVAPASVTAAPTAPAAPATPAATAAPTRIPTANEIVAEFQAKKAAAAKAVEAGTAPVMPAVTMPSAESVARAMTAQATAPAAQATPVAPVVTTTTPAAPTLAPRPAVTPTSPVASAAPVAAAPTTPTAAPAAPASPISDPGAFHIPGM